MWQKEKVWVITIYLANQDEEGEPINWTSPSEEYFASTYEEAAKMREDFLNGKDAFYGNLVEECIISDEPEEREFWRS